MFIRALLFVVLNILFWGLIFLVQENEEFEGTIPRRSTAPTKPFRYLQDWHTATWGDWVGVSLVDAVAGYSMSVAHMPLLVVSTLIGFIFVFTFHIRAMQKNHRPDSGYPKPGIISTSGFLHLVYFFAQMSICAYVFLLALTRSICGLPLLLALAGAMFYILCLEFDITSGKFAEQQKK